jgi:beta-carotene 3-hydroxylase
MPHTPFDIPWYLGVLLFLGTVAAMEVAAILGHKYVMHGFGWFLHKSHHTDRFGWFEWNDLYGVMGAAVAISLFWFGVEEQGGSFYVWLAGGITAYGAIYFGFHDIIVHRRIETGYVPRSPYMKRIVQAHRLHHVVESRDGTVSFGFIWAPPIDELKRQLAENTRTGKAVVRQNPVGRNMTGPA